ncbi:MAG: hypothetical protein HW416_2696 [Chloroflexi bacterium]|nr:hypothetical protein [Chloroflexota bacterium]
MRFLRRSTAAALITIALAGCAAPTAPATTQGSSQPQAQQPAQPKRMVASILGNPFTLNTAINSATGATQPGVPEIEELVHAGMAIAGPEGLRPQLAEAVPSLDNGLWKLLADGRMETTWKIKPNATWHDGTPFTSADLAFTYQVVNDPDMTSFRSRTYDSIESVQTPDPRTVVVTWKRPFISADAMFSMTSTPVLGIPLPKHLLERPFASDKAAFIDLPYWSDDFVGTGPFKLSRWERDSFMVLAANDAYVLGRPKLDEIEIRFNPDPNNEMAAVLAGAVEVTLGRGLTVEQAAEVRDQWSSGKLLTGPARWAVIYPQLLTPDPAVVGNVEFRRALLHAIDRKAMADTFERGVSSVADSFLDPNQAQYREIEERNVVHYPYDTRRADQLIVGVGYAKGADGTFRDAIGQKLTVELRTADLGANEKWMLAVTDYWQRVGVGADPLLIPRQRFGDNEWRWTFPSFEITKRGHDVKGLPNLHSSQTPLPENRFLGNNVSRYMSPEFDTLLDKFSSTIPRAERTQVLGQIIHRISDELINMGLFYDPEPALISNRLINVGPIPTLDSTQAWNAVEWDVR